MDFWVSIIVVYEFSIVVDFGVCYKVVWEDVVSVGMVFVRVVIEVVVEFEVVCCCMMIIFNMFERFFFDIW